MGTDQIKDVTDNTETKTKEEFSSKSESNWFVKNAIDKVNGFFDTLFKTFWIFAKWGLLITAVFWVLFVFNYLNPSDEEKLSKMKASLNEMRSNIISGANAQKEEEEKSIKDLETKLAEAKKQKQAYEDCIAYNEKSLDSFEEPKKCESFLASDNNSTAKAETKTDKTDVSASSLPVKSNDEVKEVDYKREPVIVWIDKLFYTALKDDKCRITQDESSHMKKSWGSMIALDFWCWFKAQVFAPSFNNEKIEFTFENWKDKFLWNYGKLHFEKDWAKYFYLIWHLKTRVKDWEKVISWERLWEMNISWVSTWYHTHLELWKDWVNISLTSQSQKLLQQRENLNEVKKDTQALLEKKSNVKTTVAVKEAKVQKTETAVFAAAHEKAEEHKTLEANKWEKELMSSAEIKLEYNWEVIKNLEATDAHKEEIIRDAAKFISMYEAKNWPHLTAYWDVTRYSIWYWTISYKWEKITEEEAFKRFIDVLAIKYDDKLSQFPKWVQIAMLSYKYNTWHFPWWNDLSNVTWLYENWYHSAMANKLSIITAWWKVAWWLVERREWEKELLLHSIDWEWRISLF